MAVGVWLWVMNLFHYYEWNTMCTSTACETKRIWPILKNHPSICLEELRDMRNKIWIADIRAETRNWNLLNKKQITNHQILTLLSREQQRELDFLVTSCLLTNNSNFGIQKLFSFNILASCHIEYLLRLLIMKAVHRNSLIKFDGGKGREPVNNLQTCVTPLGTV
jgi:hypothetical protein